MSNINLTNAKFDTLTERIRIAVAQNLKVASGLVSTIDKSNGQLKKALCPIKKKTH